MIINTNKIRVQIRLATQDVHVGILEKAQLELDFLATLVKLIYAFIWQEYALTSADIFLDPEVNVLGARAMSSVNALANSLSSFPVLSEPLQSGYGVYPGDTWCQPQEQCCHEYLVKTDGIPNIFVRVYGNV